MKLIKYSIIIGAYNHFDLTKACIESVIKYTDLSECDVIVVANGCTDKTEAYVLSLGKPFRLISYAEPLGFPRAYNEGIKAARGRYIVLLNNDTVLLEQKPSEWLQTLETPFLDDEKMAVTGPLMSFSEPANSPFIIFFCAMIPRAVFAQLGALDEMFGWGCGEDTDFCVKAIQSGLHIAQVPDANLGFIEGSDTVRRASGGFPIWHKGNGTTGEIKEFSAALERNNNILIDRYNPQKKYGNNWERHVWLKDDDIKSDFHRREIARYTFARDHLTGKRILEIGCATGYAKRFWPADLDYTGTDYDQTIIDLANENYGDDHYKFICRDSYKLDWDELGHFDTIVCFEHLEHLTNGKEFAQELKQHCDTLICSTPYNEPPGLWGQWHVLHHLKESDFPDFEYHFIQEDGMVADTPDSDHGNNLLLFKWEKGKVYKPAYRILASVSTKDRYDILPLCIQSIAMQTLKPNKLVIFDDGEQKDLRSHPIYEPIFAMLKSCNIEWEVKFGAKKGQHFNHQIANTLGYDFVWRIDDDEIAEPDVLEKLMSHFTPKIGAVGGAVFEPGATQAGGTGKLEDIYNTPSIQWDTRDEVIEVEHLYSSFVYRAGIVNYELDLSPVAHREETIFSHKLFRKGYKLLVDLSARTYHFRQKTGGIRSHDSEFFYAQDEKIFTSHMERWGYKLICLTVGLGDHFAFLNILPQLKRKYPHLMVGAAHPEVFAGHDIKLIDMVDAFQWSKDNIYGWMIANEWDKNIIEAFATMYGVKYDSDKPVRTKTSHGNAKSKIAVA